jgi:YgiT-type zinc finger domain-containing protein
MICLICRQADVMDGLTFVNFERGETQFVITNVPARVCPRCREAYVSEDTALQLLQVAKEAFEAGGLDAQFEYRNV